MKVYLIAKNTIIREALSLFLRENNINLSILDGKSNDDLLVEVPGKLCYWSFNTSKRSTEEYIKNILASGHGSVLEHTYYTFIVTGVSRALTHELVRHRHLSFSQLSQRYVLQDEIPFLKPEVKDVNLEQEIEDFYRRSKELYRKLVEKGGDEPTTTLGLKKIRQTARYVLPQSIQTAIVVSGNARAFRHFIDLRGSRHADKEIRDLAHLFYKELQKQSSYIFDYELVKDGGDFEIVSKYPRV